MRKILIATLTAASLLSLATAANAGYWLPGPYVPTCIFTIYGPVCG
ncbi:hypothetical protein ACNJYD_02775 [Bradyrhizobium sp. DASA03005]